MPIAADSEMSGAAIRPYDAAPGRPSVVILCPTAWGLRNVVASGIKRQLEQAGVHVHLLTTAAADNALAERWQEEGARHPELLVGPPDPRNRAWDAVRVLLDAAFARRHGLATYGIAERWRRRAEGRAPRARQAAVRGLAALAAREPFYGWQIDCLERLARRRPIQPAVRRQLSLLRPAALVSTSCIVRDEIPYLLAARDLRIPTIGCILSFDNLTTKGPLPTFDHYTVWSDRMRAEVLRLHPDRNPGSVHVSGTPQFDFHRREDLRWGRAETLRRLGLPSDGRYLLYGANCEPHAPSEPSLVATFARACREHPRLAGHMILVRLHPGDAPARWAGIAAPNLTVRASRGASAVFHMDDGQALLINSLRHADACVNMASTISLDAALLGTPVVCVAFAGGSDPAENRWARECYETDHYRPIAHSGGVRIAYSLTDLVCETAAYIAAPDRDRAAREAMVDAACGPADGRAAERIAALIAGVAGGRVPEPRATPPMAWPAGVVHVLSMDDARPAEDVASGGARPTEDVAIVVATHRRPESLGRFLASLAAEPSRAHELIVVDASPDDATERVVADWAAREPLAARVRYFRIVAPLAGAAQQRNFGVRHATASLIAFFDDDVVLLPGCLSAMVRAHREGGRAVAGVSAFIVNEAHRPWAAWRVRRMAGVVLSLEPGRYFGSGHATPWSFLEPTAGLVDGDWLPAGAVMWRGDVARAVPFEESFGAYAAGEDLAMSLRARGFGRLVVAGSACVLHCPAPQGRPDLRSLGYVTTRNQYWIHRRSLGRASLRHRAWFAYGWAVETGIQAVGLVRPGRRRAAWDYLCGSSRFWAELLAGR